MRADGIKLVGHLMGRWRRLSRPSPRAPARSVGSSCSSSARSNDADAGEQSEGVVAAATGRHHTRGEDTREQERTGEKKTDGERSEERVDREKEGEKIDRSLTTSMIVKLSAGVPASAMMVARKCRWENRAGRACRIGAVLVSSQVPTVLQTPICRYLSATVANPHTNFTAVELNSCSFKQGIPRLDCSCKPSCIRSPARGRVGGLRAGSSACGRSAHQSFRRSAPSGSRRYPRKSHPLGQLRSCTQIHRGSRARSRGGSCCKSACCKDPRTQYEQAEQESMLRDVHERQVHEAFMETHGMAHPIGTRACLGQSPRRPW